MKHNDHLTCTGLDISIDDDNSETFINKKQVKQILETKFGDKIEGAEIEQLNIKTLENTLRKNAWISNVQLYVDNQQQLHVGIAERIPVARIFTQGGQSFYFDSAATVMPLSDNQTANVPVFTNAPNQQTKMLSADSLTWRQVCELGKFIKADSMLLMQIGQVDVLPNNNFDMYPTIGSHVIRFGSIDNMQDKFHRLSMFYKQVFGKVGLNKYAVIDVRYDKQIVATLKGKETGKIDSAKAMEAFQQMIDQSAKEAVDTTVTGKLNINELRGDTALQPKSLDDAGDQQSEMQQQAATVVKPVIKQIIKPAIKQPIKLPLKNVTTKPKINILQHNAPIVKHVMPKPVKTKPTLQRKPAATNVLQHSPPKKAPPKKLVAKPKASATKPKNDY